MRFKKPNKTFKHLVSKDAIGFSRIFVELFNDHPKQKYMDSFWVKEKRSKKFNATTIINNMTLKWYNPNYYSPLCK